MRMFLSDLSNSSITRGPSNFHSFFSACRKWSLINHTSNYWACKVCHQLSNLSSEKFNYFNIIFFLRSPLKGLNVLVCSPGPAVVNTPPDPHLVSAQSTERLSVVQSDHESWKWDQWERVQIIFVLNEWNINQISISFYYKSSLVFIVLNYALCFIYDDNVGGQEY